MTKKPTALTDTLNSKHVGAFLEVIYKKMFGKSMDVVDAENQIDVLRVWERHALDKQNLKLEKQNLVLDNPNRDLEKPYWEQMDQATKQRKYLNLGAVLTKAAPHITDPESKIADDNDFFWNGLEHCKDISNEEMQELLAKIIAGEYNAPETHSVATLQVLKSLDKNSITQFEHICSFLVYNHELPISFFNSSDDLEILFTKFNTSYNILQSLQSIGLFMSNLSVRQHRYRSDRNPVIPYFKKTLVFEPNQQSPAPNSVKYPGKYALSQVGVEIMQYLQPKFNSEYFDWLKQNYKIAGFKLIKPLE